MALWLLIPTPVLLWLFTVVSNRGFCFVVVLLLLENTFYFDRVSTSSGYTSSSRRRAPFVPFALRNNTGSELWFTTVTTTPSRYWQHRGRLVSFRRLSRDILILFSWHSHIIFNIFSCHSYAVFMSFSCHCHRHLILFCHIQLVRNRNFSWWFIYADVKVY